MTWDVLIMLKDQAHLAAIRTGTKSLTLLLCEHPMIFFSANPSKS
jgi:hypothetical protein